VAWECPQTGLYHVCDDNIVAEVVKDGHPVKEGESGELVITALHAYAMPFIRYRMGDVVVKGPDTCHCGQPFSTFLKIEGRIRDYFMLPDGRRVHPLEVVLPVITDNASWLNQFQLTQETETRFVLRVSVLRKPIKSELLILREIVKDRIGPGAEFQIEIVDHIPFEASGKFKDCLSLLQSDE
jgi:phenylacetate-CoA ligase